MTKAENYFFIFLSLVFMATCSFLLSHMVKNYTAYNYTYDDVTYEQLTFMGYEARHNSKSGTSYKLFFEESAEPLIINNITCPKLDKKSL